MDAKRRQRGQAVVFITMTVPVMFGLMGMVIDFGWAYFRKEAANTAASSAAMASIVAAYAAGHQSCGDGTTHWNCTATYSCPASPALPTGSNLDNGCLYAMQNGFLNTGRQTVTMHAGTGSAPSAGGMATSYYVIATVSEKIPTLFSAVIREPWMQVASQSTAAILGASGGCIYVLDPTASQAVRMTGTASVSTGCGVYINSSASDALSMVGTSSIVTTGGATTEVVGDASLGPNVTVSPDPTTDIARHNPADPFAANLPAAPAAGACQPTAQFSGAGTNTIPPGTYCDPVKQTGSGTLILSSGTYVLQAGIKMAGTSVLSSTGPVTLYVTGGAIDLSGSGGITLNPPTGGSYQGISIWQPASNTNGATIVGSTTQTVSGLIYLPGAQLTYTGTTSSTITTLVVDTLRMVGTSSIQSQATVPWANMAPAGVYLIQ